MSIFTGFLKTRSWFGSELRFLDLVSVKAMKCLAGFLLASWLVQVFCSRAHSELSSVSCDTQLEALAYRFGQQCKKLSQSNDCSRDARHVIQDAQLFHWMVHATAKTLSELVLVFWAGFSPHDTSGRASREDLAEFVRKVHGVQLADTWLGKITEAADIDDLRSCKWERAAPYWRAASKAMAVSSRLAEAPEIYILINKQLTGAQSLYRSVLYLAELLAIGEELRLHPEWCPTLLIIDLQDHCKSVAGAILERVEVQSRREDLVVQCVACSGHPAACTGQAGAQVRRTTRDFLEESCEKGDCKNGRGTYRLANGAVYEGDWKDGKPKSKLQ